MAKNEALKSDTDTQHQSENVKEQKAAGANDKSASTEAKNEIASGAEVQPETRDGAPQAPEADPVQVVDEEARPTAKAASESTDGSPTDLAATTDPASPGDDAARQTAKESASSDDGPVLADATVAETVEPDLEFDVFNETPTTNEDAPKVTISSEKLSSDDAASGDGDASDPSRIDEMEKATDPGPNQQSSGDGDASDPSKMGDAEDAGPIRSNPEINEFADSGDGDASDPSRTMPPEMPDDQAINDDKQAASGDGDASDPSDATVAQMPGQSKEIDADLETIVGVEQHIEIPVDLMTEIVDSGAVDQEKLSNLLGGSQITPGQVSQVSTGIAQSVEITDNKDGSFSVEETDVSGSTIRQYDANGNLVVEQHDGPDGTTILTYSEGQMTVLLLMDDGTIIEAVHYDDGGGNLTITGPDGETQTATVPPPAGSEGSDDAGAPETGAAADSDSGAETDDGSGDDEDDEDEESSSDQQADSTSTDETTTTAATQGSGASDGKGTPNPADDTGDGPELFFVSAGRLGQQEQASTERGIEAKLDGGHTDPDGAEESSDSIRNIDFLTSDLGAGQVKNDQDAIEHAGGGHTDPSADAIDTPEFLTADELRQIEYRLSGGGVVDPVDDGDEHGGSPVDPNNVGGSSTQEEDHSMGPVFNDLGAVAESASAMIDELQFEVAFDIEDVNF